MPYCGSTSRMAVMRNTESSSEYRKVASCSPNPLSTPSTMLSRYMKGAASPKICT